LATRFFSWVTGFHLTTTINERKLFNSTFLRTLVWCRDVWIS